MEIFFPEECIYFEKKKKPPMFQIKRKDFEKF